MSAISGMSLGHAAEVDRLIDRPVLVGVDEPLAAAVQDGGARARTGKVAHQADITGRAEDHLQVEGEIEIAVENEFGYRWAIHAYGGCLRRGCGRHGSHESRGQCDQC